MNQDNKNRMIWGAQVLALFILAAIGIGASFGCFNYATLAKQVGDPEGIFWLVGVGNLAAWGYAIYKIGKAIHNSKL